MNSLVNLVGEGGYQAFTLNSTDRLWLYITLAAGVVGIVSGLILARGVLAADQGGEKMKEIAKAIQEGAEAFLARQFKTILIIIVPLAVLIFFTATKVVRPDNSIALTFTQDGIYRVIAFLAGAAFSGLTGFIGMSIAVRGNVRTAAAATNGEMAPALKVAFRTGAVTGMLCVGLGLVGAAGIFLIFQNSATAVLIGFAFGASLIALFMRVGGGIFTKAADVGADLVGKVEAGIPEDDPRNAATIADNVGDNVGDCAGMAADLFESYEITIIAALILGWSAFGNTRSVLFPLIVPAIGVITSDWSLGCQGSSKRQERTFGYQPWVLAFARSDGHRCLLCGRVLRPRHHRLLGSSDRSDFVACCLNDHRALHLNGACSGQRDSGVRSNRTGDDGTFRICYWA